LIWKPVILKPTDCHPEQSCCHPEPVEGRTRRFFAFKHLIVQISSRNCSQGALRQAQDDSLWAQDDSMKCKV